jgi:hypothetical protein
MEVQPHSRACAARSFVLMIALSLSVAAWGDAQTPNPLYQEAHDLWQQVSASAMSVDQKAALGKRFGDLAATQQQLWSEAGDVDQGECTDQCLDDYNATVEQWQSDLSAFSSDARAALDAIQPVAGVWKTFGDFHQVNVGCFQVWVCVPASQVMHDPDMKIVSEPEEKRVVGVCQMTDNPTSCGSCTATVTPPTDSCTWHLEPRQ